MNIMIHYVFTNRYKSNIMVITKERGDDDMAKATVIFKMEEELKNEF